MLAPPFFEIFFPRGAENHLLNMKFAASIVLALAMGTQAFTPSSFGGRMARGSMKMSAAPATAPAVEQTLATAANEARGLAMDSIAAAESIPSHLERSPGISSSPLSRCNFSNNIKRDNFGEKYYDTRGRNCR